MPSNNDPASIPLHCNICQKKPKFSDISHLLTHIASKGHLSTYYKIKVRSSTEDAARQLIEEYDSWYATWRIESLMSERMNTKEIRRKQKARQPALPTANSLQPDGNSTCPPKSDFAFHHGMDPLLDESAIKQENTSYTSSLDYAIEPFRNPMQPFAIPSWMTLPYSYEVIQEKTRPFDEDDKRDFPTTWLYSPTPSRANQVHQSPDSMLYGAVDGADADEDNRSTEYNRLKGVLWPGMDMFDSATPDMKRRRNQKKSLDVVDRLEAQSKEIEATEVVYSAEGIAQKARPITGFPHSDSSPMKATRSLSPKKPRKTSRRKPPTSKDPDGEGGRASRRGRGTRRGTGRGSKKGRDQNGEPTAPAPRAAAGTKRGIRRGTKLEESPDHELSAVLPETHGMEYLTSAFEYRSPAQTTSDRPGHFRPALDWTGYSHVSFNGTPGYSNGLPNDTNMVPAWDFLGHDVGITLLNPLFLGSNAAEHDEDDEKTISASVSDS
ncbi:hypothetical protein K461DRAFT_317266 [Myriangium duriaei CBS 260.36]|uniref:Uncharacterized protein n=1 Tax=Myriangium duriaei CBS 260.36 TaxID=1168546 RepID=A0A9P4J846_9PEZI|nr:hypothetical protein K461DRAFT_317266 [Myriangium duriaei CBS 260.36]